jgi:hypothetical protein
MPFKPKDLAVISTAGKFTMFQFTVTDPADSVLAEGFFDRAADRMRAGDVILASLPGPQTKFFTVMSNEGKKVVIAPQGLENGHVPQPAADDKPSTRKKGSVSL